MSAIGRAWMPALLVLAVLAGTGCSPATEVDAGNMAPAVPVTVARAALGELAVTATAPGKVVPALEVSLASRVPGRVARVPVDVGAAVKAGDLLLELEAAEAAAQLDQARAALAQARANADLAAANAGRMAALFAREAIPAQQWDQARSQAAAASAQVEAAAAAARLAQVNMDSTRLTAPAAGTIAGRTVHPGAYVSPGVPLLTLVDIDRVSVEATLAEADVNRVAAGGEVPVRVPAAGQQLLGRVVAVSPTMDARSKGYTVKIELPNPRQQLKGGMFAEVVLETERRTAVVVVPITAVIERGGARLAYVVKGERVEERALQLGLANADQVEVRQGIHAGEDVVTLGQNNLTDGAQVRVERRGS